MEHPHPAICACRPSIRLRAGLADAPKRCVNTVAVRGLGGRGSFECLPMCEAERPLWEPRPRHASSDCEVYGQRRHQPSRGPP